jgi:hypothetical protein
MNFVCSDKTIIQQSHFLIERFLIEDFENEY